MTTDYSNLLKMLADNGATDFASNLQAFINSNAPEGAIPVSETPAAPSPAAQAPAPNPVNDALAQFVRNKTEAAPGNPMDVRVAAINREHNKNGITASIDEKGQAVFTGTGAVIPATQQQRGMATNVQGLISQLQTTTDGDKARGLLAQINTSMAEEQAKMYTQAQTFANNKLQVPTLEQQLADNIALDRGAKDYVPGAGDSPITAKIRTALEDARGKADAEAKRYLQGNVSFNGLIAAEKTAQQEALRISRLQDRKDSIILQKDLALENRQILNQEKLDQEAKGLTDEQKTRLRILHPALGQAPDSSLVETLNQHMAKKDGYAEALDAPTNDLPKMAALGNSYANAILTAKEQAAGQPPELTAARIDTLKKASANPEILKQGIALTSGIAPSDKKGIEKNYAAIQSLIAPGSTKESKAQYDATRMDLARAVMEQKVQQQFSSDVSQWAIPDQAIQAAIEKTQNEVGRKDLESVLTTYVGATQGMERAKLVDNFTKYAVGAANRTRGSQLGAVDPRKLQLQIQSTETTSLLKTIGSYLDTVLYQGTPLIQLEQRGNK